MTKNESLWQFARRSPLVIALAVFCVALIVVMAVLSIDIVQQSEFARRALGYNTTDVSRPFVQLQRETLRLLGLVRAGAAEYDIDAFQLQRDLVISRLNVLAQASVRGAITETSEAAAQEIEGLWPEIESQLDVWQADPTDEVVQAQLIEALVEFEFLVNTTEINYQQTRGELIAQFGQAGQRLLLVMFVALLLLGLFVLLVAASISRFIVARNQAEIDLREARAAEAAALEASRFKDQFLAIMSHELRTPLNAIIGFLGLMTMSGKLEDKMMHMVTRCRANAERLLLIINDILDISKIESGRLELIYSQVAPRQLAERLESQMGVLGRQKSIQFRVEIAPDLPEQIAMDEDAVTKIITNLLSNAFKFTEQGSVTLRMLRLPTQWVIEVVDTGIGIPAHMHERIFESFRQVDSSSKRAYGGTGLGLAIVQHLVKAMDGSIRLKSNPGEGSVFTVTLPLQSGEMNSFDQKQILGATS